MRIKIEKGRARGTVKAPPSKSICHRLIICAAFADGVSVLSGISLCEDCLATIDCLHSLGIKTLLEGDKLTVFGGLRNARPNAPLNCRESGSTLRFFIPLALLTDEEVIFKGSDRLLQRPQTVYEDIARERGFLFEREGGGIKVRGRLRSGKYSVLGNISSQFITGLMLALSLCEGESRIVITTDTESRSYIDLTIDAMQSFGAKVFWENENSIYIKGGKYEPRELTVEGDYSGSAFTDALNLFGGDVDVTGLSECSIQGDRVYREFFALLNRGEAKISIKDCPDLGPILFAVAAAKHGGIFTDTARLRIKESDRAQAMAEELRKFGADISVQDNSVIIKKAELHPPSELLCGHNDHRIVMSLSVLLTLFGGEIDGAQAVSKSYGDFFEDLEKLNITVVKNEI